MNETRILLKKPAINEKYTWYNSEPRYVVEQYTLVLNEKGELILGTKI